MKIEIITPQFERGPNDPIPASAPIDWEAVKDMDRIALLELGCRMWNAPEDDEDERQPRWPHPGMQLLLFPGEWFSSVPEGFEIVDIMGRKSSFDRAVESDDIRAGCLAYGVLRPHAVKP